MLPLPPGRCSVPQHKAAQIIRFGPFAVDLCAHEIRKHGTRLKLSGQPMEVLALLLQRPGQVVSREELREKLWPTDTFVDFDHGVYVAINKVREVLCDSADHPRFIETLPRRGYRFIAPITFATGLEPEPHPSTAADGMARPMSLESLSNAPGGLARLQHRWLLAVLSIGMVLGVVALWRLSLGEAKRNAVGSTFAHKPLSNGTPRILIAVLPVQNLSGDPQREYISDGLTEEIISQLSRYNPERLGVIARTSSMVYKNRTQNVSQIGRELGVDYIVETSMRTSGEHIRVTAQLVNVHDQTHLWSASYDHTLADLFALQEEVARAIALNVRVEVAAASRARLSSIGPANPNVYLAYLEGRYFWNKRSPEALRTAVEHFKRAIRVDPNYAQAYAGLADAYSSLCLIADVRPKEYFPQARDAALRALQLDDGLAEAHASLAYVKFWFDWDWRGAEAEFKRAIDLNPGYATAHQWYAEYLRLMGRQEDSIAESKKAIELDPLSLIINMESGLPFYFERNQDEAIRYFQNALDLDPSFGLAHCVLGWAYEAQGRYPQAIEELQKARQLNDSPPVLSSLGHAYASAGRGREAAQILLQLQQQSEHGYVGPNFFAVVYAGLHEDEKALKALESAYGDRHWGLVWLKVEPKFDSLRGYPQYSDLLRRMDFPY